MPALRKSDGKPCGTLDKRPVNKNESMGYSALHKAGFAVVTKRGMPDFFALKPDGTFCLCEVKRNGQRMSRPQFLLFKKLSSYGVPCYYYSPKLGLKKFVDFSGEKHERS